MSDKHYVGLDLTGFENNGKTRPISRVTLTIDDENAVTAGDDTGLEITAVCPHATQAMADAILKKMKGYQYQMYTADAANIDPAAELGDGITADGVYGVLSRMSDDGGGYPDLTAPGEAELEDEFPIGEGPLTKEFNRKLSSARSYITKEAERIALSVEGIDGRLSELSVTLDGVTIKDEAGQTRIKGSSIETGSIAAGAIKAEQIQLSGAITWGDLNSAVQSNINNRGVSAATVHTLITQDLVASPTIIGSNIYGGKFWDDDKRYYLELGAVQGYGIGLTLVANERPNPPIFTVYGAPGDSITMFTAKGEIFLSCNNSNKSALPMGTWNFSTATVTGLKFA